MISEQYLLSSTSIHSGCSAASTEAVRLFGEETTGGCHRHTVVKTVRSNLQFISLVRLKCRYGLFTNLFPHYKESPSCDRKVTWTQIQFMRSADFQETFSSWRVRTFWLRLPLIVTDCVNINCLSRWGSESPSLRLFRSLEETQMTDPPRQQHTHTHRRGRPSATIVLSCGESVFVRAGRVVWSPSYLLWGCCGSMCGLV